MEQDLFFIEVYLPGEKLKCSNSNAKIALPKGNMFLMHFQHIEPLRTF